MRPESSSDGLRSRLYLQTLVPVRYLISADGPWQKVCLHHLDWGTGARCLHVHWRL